MGQGRFITVGEKRFESAGWTVVEGPYNAEHYQALAKVRFSPRRAAGGIADPSALIWVCAGAQQWQDHGVNRIIGEICEFDVAVQAPMLDLLRGLSR